MIHIINNKHVCAHTFIYKCKYACVWYIYDENMTCVLISVLYTRNNIHTENENHR